MTINPKWLEMLRDPATQQALGILRSENGAMCCLGVGLVAAGVPYRETDKKTNHRDLPCHFEAPDHWQGWTTAMPSDGQYDILGISPRIGAALAHCNDGGATFKEIADFLETGNHEPLLKHITYPDHILDLQDYNPN